LSATSNGGGDVFVYGGCLYVRYIDPYRIVHFHHFDRLFLLFFFCSPNGGSSLFEISLRSRNPALPATGLAAAEYIKQITTSHKGDLFAVLTSSNRFVISSFKPVFACCCFF
jgi:hypothetical protein